MIGASGKRDADYARCSYSANFRMMSRSCHICLTIHAYMLCQPSSAKLTSILAAKERVFLSTSEGAAYTIFAVEAGCLPESMPEPVRVVFERPFAFAIFSHSGAPLFVGAYVGN